MKKVMLILLAAIAFSCGDRSSRSSESNSDPRTEDNYSKDAVEADTTHTQSDTSATPGMDRKGNVDTTSRKSNP